MTNYLASGKNRSNYHGTNGILSERIQPGTLVLDKEIFDQTLGYKQSLAMVLEDKGSEVVLQGSVSKYLAEISYKNNRNFRKKYKQICNRKDRIHLRHKKFLIPLLLPNEEEYSLQVSNELMSIRDLITAYEQTLESNLQKAELLVNEQGHWKRLKVLPEDVREITEEDGVDNDEPENIVETLEDGGAFIEAENTRYNLRRGAKKQEGFYRE